MVLKVDWELIGLGISRWCEEYKCDQCGKQASTRNYKQLCPKFWYLMHKCLKKTKTHDENKRIGTYIDLCDLCDQDGLKGSLFFNHSLSTFMSTSVASESINAE